MEKVEKIKVLYTEQEIEKRVTELAEEIGRVAVDSFSHFIPANKGKTKEESSSFAFSNLNPMT